MVGEMEKELLTGRVVGEWYCGSFVKRKENVRQFGRLYSGLSTKNNLFKYPCSILLYLYAKFTSIFFKEALFIHRII